MQSTLYLLSTAWDRVYCGLWNANQWYIRNNSDGTKSKINWHTNSNYRKAMKHDTKCLFPLLCAFALNTTVLCRGNGDATPPSHVGDSTRRTETATVAFSLSHQQSSDWQNGQVFHVDSRCTLRYRSVWNNSTVQISSEIRGHFATMYASLSGVKSKPILRCTDGEISGQLKSVFPRGWIVDPYIRASVNTPITEIYPTPTQSGQRSATWWDPIQSDQACGFHSRLLSASTNPITLLFGTNIQQIRARLHTRATDNPLTTSVVESYKTTVGIECLIQSDLIIDSTIRISNLCHTRSTALAFSAMQCSLDNEIKVKFWRYFGLTLCTAVRYDQSISRRVTFKHVSQLGLIWER